MKTIWSVLSLPLFIFGFIFGFLLYPFYMGFYTGFMFVIQQNRKQVDDKLMDELAGMLQKGK